MLVDRASLHRAMTGMVGSATLALLLWAGPRPDDVPLAPAQWARWLAATPVDRAVVMLAGLTADVCAGYLLLSAVLVGLGRLPGITGRLASGLAARTTPALVRRALESALGLTMATASVATGSAPALAGGPTVPRAPAASLPAATATPPSPLPSLDRPAAPPPPSPHRLPAAPAPAKPPRAVPAVPAVVVVQYGDSLWRIAARHLAPGATDVEVAAAWPRWYAANRDVVGPDPGLLLPGQRLRPPR